LGKRITRAKTAAQQLSGEPLASHRLFVHNSSNNIEYLVDTSSEISVIPQKNLDKNSINPDYTLFAANGTKIEIYLKLPKKLQ
jgi:hypothetical protein